MIKQIKAFVICAKYEWRDEPDYVISVVDYSASGPEFALVREQIFDVEIPDDFDPRPQQLATLRQKKQEVLAEAQVKANEIDEQISRLLCLEAPKESA